MRDKSHLVITEKKTGKPKRFKINQTLRESIQSYTTGVDDEDLFLPLRSDQNRLPESERTRFSIGQLGRLDLARSVPTI
ncbi:hypothetical protein P9578_08540 [Brevibacillus choshinensis]|uniref:hypothetical protein n=1 Tax=Brevibacillus choshinensis TaxID=54911 RepID=UPI002E1E34C8|nr:hypothetical protein [Brevibacillus choshinensis]